MKYYILYHIQKIHLRNSTDKYQQSQEEKIKTNLLQKCLTLTALKRKKADKKANMSEMSLIPSNSQDLVKLNSCCE